MGDPIAIDLGKKVVKSFRGDKPTATPAPKPGSTKVDPVKDERRRLRKKQKKSLATSRPLGQANIKTSTLGA